MHTMKPGAAGSLPFGRDVTMVHQGDCLIGGDEDLTFSTVLGSCVAACIRDNVTRIGGMNVDAQDKGGDGDSSGTVRMSFTNKQPPAPVIDHYAKSAVDAGYGDIARTESSLSASKDDKSFVLAISPDGTGSKGTITISGKDKD